MKTDSITNMETTIDLTAIRVIYISGLLVCLSWAFVAVN